MKRGGKAVLKWSVPLEKRATLTRLKRVKRKEGVEGSGSLWKGFMRVRKRSVSLRKWNKRWFWNEQSCRTHTKERRKIVMLIFSIVGVFPNDFTSFAFPTWRWNSKVGRNLLDFHCSLLPASLETPQDQALAIIQHICSWPQIPSVNLGEVWPWSAWLLGQRANMKPQSTQCPGAHRMVGLWLA